MITPAEVRRNLDTVEKNILKACKKVGRNPQEIKIVSVTKRQAPEIINFAIASGLRTFGENYPEELLRKLPQIAAAPDVEWHMIGHLQSKKSKIVANHFHQYHSLDSKHVAEKLDQELLRIHKSLKTFIEINIANEPGKSGWSIDTQQKWELFLDEIRFIQTHFHSILLSGIMVMPPIGQSSEDSRVHFRSARTLLEKIQTNFPGTEFCHLSMGTSFDYPVAVEEGATFLRLGEAILGRRE